MVHMANYYYITICDVGFGKLMRAPRPPPSMLWSINGPPSQDVMCHLRKTTRARRPRRLCEPVLQPRERHMA